MSNAPPAASRISTAESPPVPPPRDARSAERLRRLVDAHLDLASRMMRNVGAPDALVEDIVQQACAICAARIADIKPGKERAFLVQTALRLAANARRVRSQAREIAADELPEIADQALSPEELSDRRRAASRLDDILAQMGLDERAVFLLYEVEELTMAEIAGVLEIPAGTVASRLRRAREDFLARVHRAGLAPKSPRVRNDW